MAVPGGGTVTFGAPMVVHSERPEQLYAQLAAMERFAERSSRRNQPHQLQFHNLVPLSPIFCAVLTAQGNTQ